MAKYTERKPTAQQLSKEFFERMRDKAPELYEALKAQVEFMRCFKNPEFVFGNLLKNAEAVLASIDGGE